MVTLTLSELPVITQLFTTGVVLLFTALAVLPFFFEVSRETEILESEPKTSNHTASQGTASSTVKVEPFSI